MTNEVLALILGIPAGTLVMLTPVFITRLIISHREKMAKIRYGSEGAPGLLEEIAALRREVTELRETTTKFDMAFDASIDRLESRMDRVEQERRTTGTATASTGEAETILRRH